MTSKVISGEKSFAYDYNLQNKLERVTMTVTASGNQEITEYAYNNEGTRIKSRSWDVSGGTPVADSKKVTYFLVDSQNHTGYSQVLEEIIYDGLDYTDPDPNPLTDTPTSRKTYTIGDDVITQQSSGDPQHLLYDGHGSTRKLSGLPDGSQRVGTTPPSHPQALARYGQRRQQLRRRKQFEFVIRPERGGICFLRL